MPYKAGTPCKRPGCPGIVRDGVCSVCGNARRDKNRRDKLRGRPSDRLRLPPATWARLRALVLASEPLCRDCASVGRVTPATDVHHIVGLRAGGTNEPDNLMPLCHACHAKRTARGE